MPPTSLETKRPPRAARALRPALALLPLLPAAFLAAEVAWVVVSRAGYPYHLEFLETNLLAQAVAIRETGDPYPDPATGIVPHEYGPLYPALVALFSGDAGPSLPLARAISAISTLAFVAAAAAWAARLGSGALGAFAAGATVLAGFGACGAWYDLARVDSLALALLAAGVAILHGSRPARTGASAIALALLAASAFAKQTTLPIAFLAAAAAPGNKRRRVALGSGLLALVLAAGLALQALTEGRFFRYAVLIPLSHPLHFDRFADLLAVLARPPQTYVLLLAAAAAVVLAGRGRLALLLGGAAAISLLSILKEGAWVNDLMPLVFFAGATAGARYGAHVRADRATAPLVVAGALLFAAGLAGRFDARAQIPTDLDRRAGDALVAWLREFPGRVWVADFNYLPFLADKPMLPTAYAVGEILDPQGIPREDLRDFEDGGFDLVLADPSTPASFRARLTAAYRPSPEMPTLPFAASRSFSTRTGQRLSCAEAWVPKARAVALPPFPWP